MFLVVPDAFLSGEYSAFQQRDARRPEIARVRRAPQRVHPDAWREHATLDLERPVTAVAARGRTTHQASRLNAGQRGCRLLQLFVERRHIRVLLVGSVGKIHAHGECVLRTYAGMHTFECAETAQEQPGGDQDDDRKPYFSGNQNIAEASMGASRRRGTAGLFQIADQIEARRLAGRKQARRRFQ